MTHIILFYKVLFKKNKKSQIIVCCFAVAALLYASTYCSCYFILNCSESGLNTVFVFRSGKGVKIENYAYFESRKNSILF